MSAHWVTRVHLTDRKTDSKYAALLGPAIEKQRVVMLARGEKQVIFEGGVFERSVVARFPSLEAAERCCNSPEYTDPANAASAQLRGIWSLSSASTSGCGTAVMASYGTAQR